VNDIAITDLDLADGSGNPQVEFDQSLEIATSLKAFADSHKSMALATTNPGLTKIDTYASEINSYIAAEQSKGKAYWVDFLTKKIEKDELTFDDVYRVCLLCIDPSKEKSALHSYLTGRDEERRPAIFNKWVVSKAMGESLSKQEETKKWWAHKILTVEELMTPLFPAHMNATLDETNEETLATYEKEISIKGGGRLHSRAVRVTKGFARFAIPKDEDGAIIGGGNNPDEPVTLPVMYDNNGNGFIDASNIKMSFNEVIARIKRLETKNRTAARAAKQKAEEDRLLAKLSGRGRGGGIKGGASEGEKAPATKGSGNPPKNGSGQ
jgi:hypothetical protein